ncbi:pitrilysin family protein [Cytophagaceae bacterium DM2B3-1]|uniref:Pitrilysin family protein n=1 Tax=Xanthocytophaga flava TaxID=3048013 RepID=A0ABT7CJA5_9BACT|nr:pitrilysin family protein [Xanthocytophaga flavus]MDJ1493814.1 pitrilysin family protein [Xanthocytophaga flavus]
MKKRHILAGLFCLLVTTPPIFGQSKLIEKVSKKPGEIVIPYEKYVLPNGLTLVVHEDHSDPIVHVDVTYHVGSAREEIGKSGFAHFFEHMMFQGSDHVADEEHFKVVTESGGTLNGTTNRDRTNYFETLPSNKLETALWLEADRMGFLLDAVTQKKFEIQRATVKNERGQNYDNRPYGLTYEYTSKALYPYGHPYSWLTIGYVEDLDRVNVNDLKNFFLRWYGPNNATVTVGGDVTTKDVVKLVEKYFGSIPHGPEVKNLKLPAPALTQDRYTSYEDNYIKLPMLRMIFPVPARYSSEEASLDCLAEILGQGKNSIFYKNFEKAQKAVQSSAVNSASELSGEFTLTVIPYPTQTLKDMEKTIRESLAEFEKRGVTDDDIARFIAKNESQTINGLNSVAGKVSQLASYQTFKGNPNYIGVELKNYRSVTKESVMQAYNKYIKGKAAVILSAYPKGKADIVASVDNYTISKEGYKAPDYGYTGLTYKKAKDTFDRGQKPGSGANPIVKVPPVWQKQLNNGLKIIGTQNDEIPTVTLLFNIKGGHQLSANNLSKAGVASLTASMLNEDTEKYTSEEIASELDKLGSFISFGAGEEGTTIYVETLKKNLDKTLALLQEKLYHPKFNQDDFDRLKKQQLESIKVQSTQPQAVANDVYNKTLYGSKHIKAIPVYGTAETVGTITLEDVKDFYKANFSPSVTNLVVVGDINQAEVEPKLAFLNQWEAKEVKLPTLTKAAPIEKTKLFLVDIPKAAQSEIRVGYVTDLTYNPTGDFYKATLMNYPLGGAFNSRVNLNLREDKGWTYGARTSFDSDENGGRFTFSSGVKAAASDSAVAEVMKEITNYSNTGITESELIFLKSSIGQRDALQYETGIQKARFLNRIVQYNLKPSYVEEQSKILAGINQSDINALAKQYVNPAKMNILVVGDKERIKTGLEKLGYEVVELDTKGEVVKPAAESQLSAPAASETSGNPEKESPAPKGKKEKKDKKTTNK